MALLRNLETNRLLLRLQTIADLEELYRLIYSDPEVSPPFAGRVRTLDESRERVREKEWLNLHSGGQGWGYWSVIRREDHQLIGMMLLGHPDRIYRTESYPELYKGSPYVPLFTEIGYAFGRAYWDQGFATEAARAVLEYAFRDLRVARFDMPWPKGPDNPRSFNVYRRLGFQVSDRVNVEDHNVMLTMDNYVSGLPPAAGAKTVGFDDPLTPYPHWRDLKSGINLKSPDPIETNRLVLRGIGLEDLEELSRLTNDAPSNAGLYGKVHSFDVFDGILRFAQESPLGTRMRHEWAYDGLGSWAIVRKVDGSLLGHVSLGPAARTYWMVFPEEADSPYARWEVDLVCVLGEPYWGKGYDREACEAMIEYAFRKMKLARIVNHVDESDARAISLVKSLGFAIDRNLHPHYGGLVATIPNTVL